jgi:hypothetical protein
MIAARMYDIRLRTERGFLEFADSNIYFLSFLPDALFVKSSYYSVRGD